MANKLDVGDRFPSLTLKCVDGGMQHLPDASGSKFKVVLFYRGHW
jgi:peroxiredoxin